MTATVPMICGWSGLAMRKYEPCHRNNCAIVGAVRPELVGGNDDADERCKRYYERREQEADETTHTDACELMRDNVKRR